MEIIRKDYPSQQELQELFIYEDGKLFWRNNRGAKMKAGDRAGTLIKSTGYRQTNINKTFYQEHQIVWIYNYGKYEQVNEHGEDIVVNHKNGKTDDNRIENLELSTHAKNVRYRNGNREIFCYQNKGRGAWYVRFSIDSFHKYRGNKSTQIKINFGKDFELANSVGKSLLTNGMSNDQFIKTLNLTDHDKMILEKLYTGELKKTGHTIKFRGFTH